MLSSSRQMLAALIVWSHYLLRWCASYSCEEMTGWNLGEGYSALSYLPPMYIYAWLMHSCVRNGIGSLMTMSICIGHARAWSCHIVYRELLCLAVMPAWSRCTELILRGICLSVVFLITTFSVACYTCYWTPIPQLLIATLKSQTNSSWTLVVSRYPRVIMR